MLQLSCWLGLGFWYFFFALPGTRGAILVNSSLNATPSDGRDEHADVAVCINPAQHSAWTDPTEDQFDVDNCQNAVDLFVAKVEGNLYTSYDFYSRQVYPDGPGAIGYEAWPLAQGASSGGCALVVRMTRDFANDALPISSSRFAPTSKARAAQTNSWLFIMRAFQNLFSVCVRGEGLPGWSMDTKNIVVAFWPRFGPLDVKYGIRALSSQPDADTSRTIVIS